MKKFLLLLFAVSLSFAQQAQRFKVFYPNTSNYQDVTAGTTSAVPSAAFPNPSTTLTDSSSQVFVVQMILNGGTSATGQVEGSIDGTNWESLMTGTFSLTAGQHAAIVFQSPFRYVRFNTLTNVGGGTVVALMSW